MPETSDKKKEVHVTELAGPDDRWVSVTDASRIGRRQEHTIRSWIAQGLLPVNPTRVGINRKTRQVRLSDLAKLTPIVDPDAGIATDLGMLDLPSIPKQQQLLAEQMTAFQQEVTGQLASLGGQFRSLAGKHEQFAEETRRAWQVYQQQYQTLAQRDEEHQQQLQQVRDSLLEQMTSYSHELQQTRQDLNTLVTETEQTLRQALSDQVGHSEATLRQALEAMRESSGEATEQVRQNVVSLEERLVSAVEAHEELAATVSHLQAHMDQQFSQVVGRLEPLETTLGKLQGEIQKHVERMGQLETDLLMQTDQIQATWQGRATTAENEAHRLRRDLDAQGRLQLALQEQLDEERRAREELARQVSQLLKPRQQK
jgi:chromosome segregation ATPase